MIDLHSGWKPSCPRCKVGRHDRCVGAMECGCQDPAHAAPEFDPADPAAIDQPGPGQLHHLDPDDETVIIEMQTRLYAQLREAGALQDRDPGVVLRRALEHYLWCERAGCRHEHDERPGDTGDGLADTGEDGAPPVPLVADPNLVTEIIRP